MALDTQGILAAVTIAMYVPFLFVSFKVVSKSAYREVMDHVVGILHQVLGGSFLVAAQEITPTSTGLYIGGFALLASGLSPLLICTRDLLHSVCAHQVSILDGVMDMFTEYAVAIIFVVAALVQPLNQDFLRLESS